MLALWGSQRKEEVDLGTEGRQWEMAAGLCVGCEAAADPEVGVVFLLQALL